MPKKTLFGIAIFLTIGATSPVAAQTFTGDSTPIFGEKASSGQIGISVGSNTFQTIGTLDPGTHLWRPSLAVPTASVLGGVLAFSAPSHSFLTGVSNSGSPVAAQPLFSDIGGTVAAGQLPMPTVSSLGGVMALAASSHQFLTAINAAGTPVTAQPTFADIGGTLGTGQIGNGSVPAAALASGAAASNLGSAGGDLTGTYPNPTIASNAVTNGKSALMGAGTIKSNLSGSTASPADNTVSSVADATFGATVGTIPVRGASTYSGIAPSTSGLVLTSNGPGTSPSYQPTQTTGVSPFGVASFISSTGGGL